MHTLRGIAVLARAASISFIHSHLERRRFNCCSAWRLCWVRVFSSCSNSVRSPAKERTSFAAWRRSYATPTPLRRQHDAGAGPQPVRIQETEQGLVLVVLHGNSNKV